MQSPAGGPEPGPRHEPPTRLAIDLSLATVRDFYASTSGDLCFGALFIECAQPPPSGTDLPVVLRLPNGQAIEADARVIRVTGTAPGPSGCTLAFVAYDGPTARRVARWLSEVAGDEAFSDFAVG